MSVLHHTVCLSHRLYYIRNLPTFLNTQGEKTMNGRSNQGREIEELNLSLRQRDKLKDDAIAQLSDQLVTITRILHEFERRQITV